MPNKLAHFAIEADDVDRVDTGVKLPRTAV